MVAYSLMNDDVMNDDVKCFRSSVDIRDHRAIKDHWTPERRRQAEPKPLREPKDPAIGKALEEAVKKCGVLAKPTTARVGEVSQFPFAAVGKLFFNWEGKAWVGSAWIIDTTPQGIITAGHNVYDEAKGGKGAWSSDILFDLQYADGTFPAAWEIAQSIVLQGWSSKWSSAYDFAVLVPKQAVKDQPALGVRIDETADSYSGLGYPAQPITGYDFQGKYMWQSDGAFISNTKNVVSAYNNLSKGSSGGPWCARVKDNWVANGLQSGGPASNPDVSYSPYLTQEGFGALLTCGGLKL